MAAGSSGQISSEITVQAKFRAAIAHGWAGSILLVPRDTESLMVRMATRIASNFDEELTLVAQASACGFSSLQVRNPAG